MNEIWTNDISESMNDESYQRDAYDDYLDDGGDLDFDTWLEDDFYQDYGRWENEYDIAEDNFDFEIIPMIENSSSIKDFPTTKQWGYAPPLFLVGSRSGWRAGSGGIVWESIEDMRKWVLYPGYDSVTTIYNDGGEMYISQSDHDGSTGGTLCTLTSDEAKLAECCKDIYEYDLSDYRDRYPDDDATDDEVVLDFLYNDLWPNNESYLDLSEFLNSDCLVPVKI